MVQTIVSGIRPTGNLHLGNYYGTIISFLKMQKKEYNCYFFIADLHSLTTHTDPKILYSNVRNVISECIACGLDHEKVVIYVQSDIPEITQLYLLLNMLAPISELKKTVSFKEKIRKNPDNINAGLFTYPVLMASDILILNADYVPVGEDQKQHLELTRNYASRFNSRYNVKFFKQPTCILNNEKLIKIPGLDGSQKMGKSDKNCIYLIDRHEIVEKKIRSAITDNGPIGENTPKTKCIKNLFAILQAVSSPDVFAYYDNLWVTGATKWYSDLKGQLVEDIVKVTDPICKRINDIRDNDAFLCKVIKDGAEKAREIAKKTLRKVKELMGFKYF
jgi:tryptophanyl-tRNA synthetase